MKTKKRMDYSNALDFTVILHKSIQKKNTTL